MKTSNSDMMVLVSLHWNGEPLSARALSAGETASLGDGRDTLAPLSEEVLGCAALAIGDNRGGAHVRVPEGKVASIGGSGRVRLVAGPARAALSRGEEASLLFGAFEVKVAAMSAEPAPRRRRVGAGAWIHTAVVAVVHAGLLFAGSRAALASSIEDTAADVDTLRGYLAAVEERSAAADPLEFDVGGKEDARRAGGRRGNGQDAGGERREGDAGKAGRTESRAKNRHFGAPSVPARGTAAAETEATTAEAEIEEARHFGIIRPLTTMNKTYPWRSEGDIPWGAPDPLAAAGGLLGRITGESEGSAGLALSGTGEGGGGRGEGIGLGTIGTIGHADGLAGLGTGGAGAAAAVGFGRSGGRWGRERRVRIVRWVHDTLVSGRLPPESVQRVIRANFGRFRGCYQEGLVRNPALAGRVSTRFVIGRDGAVSNVGDAGADLPDPAVRQCVRRAFYGLSFPQPEGGIVEVVYPIVFSNQ